MPIIYSKGVRIGLRFFCHRNLIKETINLDRWRHINRPAANGATTYKHNKMEKDLLTKSQSDNHHHPGVITCRGDRPLKTA